MENAPAQLLQILKAKDSDLGLNAQHEFFLESANNIPFLLNSDGRLYSTRSIDREENAFFELKVICTDRGVPKLNSTATIRIKACNILFLV